MRRPAAPVAGLLIALLAAACQPLPHPFADDRPPPELLRLPDTAGVSIAPVEGEPEAVAAKLGPAIAAALLKREIPASDKTIGRGSYRLFGRVVESPLRGGKTAMSVLWRLYDASGRTIGERQAGFEAPTADWKLASEPVVARLAGLSADEVARLLVEHTGASKPPARDTASAQAAPQDRGRVRVAVGKVRGAPGDGATSLAKAIETVLRRQDVAIVDASDKADLYIQGEVAVTPAKSDKQHIKVLWRVRRADGKEIGTVGQENDIPRGLLDGSWGDVAYTVAIAAGDGLLQLLARGVPPPKPAAPEP